IAILFPVFLALVAPMSLLYALLAYLYAGPNASIKALEGVSRSPVFAHLSATLQGLSSIRAYRVEERFIADADAKINRTNSFFFHF
ncbi:ABC transporter transmembrane domain-containing protein, partial [Acinetobacter baumannii]